MSLAELTRALAFPPPETALDGGLLAVGGDLSPQRLLLAYSMGIFPWFGERQPILWYSPDPRLVLELDQLHLGRSLRRSLRSGRYRVVADSHFSDVVRACATAPRPGQHGTWITRSMQDAYIELHRLGFAHSVEAFEGDTLVGGLYGVSLGRAFFGESMFSQRDDASKVAFCHLVAALRQRDYHFVDCQVHTPLFERLGAREIARSDFLARLQRALLFPTWQGKWTLDADIDALLQP